MKGLTNYLLVFVMVFALQSCSNDDEPMYVDPDILSGEWYLTNIRGWEYDEDEPGGKYRFNETYNFNGQGIPVGDNIDDAHKIVISRSGSDTETDTYYFAITSYYWSLSNQEWMYEERGSVKLKGNQLIDGTMKADIIELSDEVMATYQKDEDGEYYMTYMRL